MWTSAVRTNLSCPGPEGLLTNAIGNENPRRSQRSLSIARCVGDLKSQHNYISGSKAGKDNHPEHQASNGVSRESPEQDRGEDSNQFRKRHEICPYARILVGKEGNDQFGGTT